MDRQGEDGVNERVARVSRDAAVGAFGVHWARVDGAVIERLGRLPENANVLGECLHAADAETLIRREREDRLQLAKSVLERGARMLSSPAGRFARFLAARTGGKTSSAMRVADAGVKASMEKARQEIAALDGWSPDVVTLPDFLVMPELLAPGEIVWEVSWLHPLTGSIEIHRMEIESADVFENVALPDGGVTHAFDYTVLYRCTLMDGSPRCSQSFHFQRADRSDPAVPQVRANVAFFLTRTAAVAKAAEWAARLRSEADRVSALVADLERGEIVA